MRISRLDLFGFKSFPERTTFHFGAGVSCVVGPNGSGKSNVVDALRWCIGEQSPRSLRGSEMADVIFAGSEDRRPVGFAEVQLTLTAEGGDPFPGDYVSLSEVQVGRRLHRTGASEYLINQSRVRRRDVVELLMDSGIGNNLYSFIEQGQVDKVITATPDERRSVIDEAAGIARYKARRAEAQSRLEASAVQLDRASDVVEEMTRRLKSLERQVVRAAEFRRLRARIRQAELHLALAKIQGLADEQQQLQEQQQQLQGDDQVFRQKLAEHAVDIESRRRELEVVDESVSTKRDRLAELDASIREQEAMRRLHEERREELKRAQSQSEQELARSREELARAEEEGARLAQERAALSEEHQRVEAQAEEATRSHEAARTKAKEARDLAQQAEEALQAVIHGRMASEATRASAEAKRAALQQRSGQLADEGTRLRASVEQAEQAATDAAAGQATCESVLSERVAEGQRTTAAWEAAGRHQESVEAALGEALRLREERYDAERAEAEAVQRRARAWVDATDVVEQRRLDALDLEWRERVRAAEAAGVAETKVAVEEALAGVRSDSQARIDAADGRTSEARQVVQAAEHEASRAQGVLDEVIEEQREVEVRRAQAEGRLAGARARLSVDDPVLQNAPSLLDRVPQQERAAVLDRLGERALRPCVDDLDALVGVASRLSTDEGAQLWFRPDGSLPEAARAGWVPSIRVGLSRAADGVAVAGPGFRVAADGWVELGTTTALRSAAEQEQVLLEQLGSLRVRTKELSEDRRKAEEIRAAAADALAQATQRWKEAQQEAEEERVAAHREMAAAEVQAADEARLRTQAEVSQLAVRRDHTSSEARAARDARVARVRQQVDDVVRALSERAPDPEGDSRIASIEARASEARAATAAALSLRDEVQESVEAARRELQRSRAQHEAAKREQARLLEELTARGEEGNSLLAQLTHVGEELAAVVAALATFATEESTQRDQVGAHRVAAASCATEEEAAAVVVAEAQDARARQREGAAALAARQEALNARRASTQAAIERAQERAREAVASIEASERAREEAASRVGVATEERAGSWDALEEERARLKRLRSVLAEVEAAQQTVRTNAETVASSLERVTHRLQEVQTEVELIAQRMDERYQLSIHTMRDQLFRVRRLDLTVDDDVAQGLTIGDRTVDGVQGIQLIPEDVTEERRVLARVQFLEEDRKRLASLGEVNLAALQEYRELHGRFEEMDAHRADLESSMASIREAIAKMNRICRERFREAFDQVKEHFQETYPRLVGGGSARLALTDEEDILECGVDIFVQPPGKRLQNLGLLSGGEKAMTAIALLIALFRVKPSPFCVLDEVDAPLDEANGARFNEMLREMAGRSQFLVITHNRKTMECADTLYGITMAKPGVSRLVSVRM
ncbi:MAG: AAA family ATPase [Myxococcales bacterium]|nr:AAA family ATPase [Myxococcales bacterium]